MGATRTKRVGAWMFNTYYDGKAWMDRIMKHSDSFVKKKQKRKQNRKIEKDATK